MAPNTISSRAGTKAGERTVGPTADEALAWISIAITEEKDLVGQAAARILIRTRTMGLLLSRNPRPRRSEILYAHANGRQRFCRTTRSVSWSFGLADTRTLRSRMLWIEKYSRRWAREWLNGMATA